MSQIRLVVISILALFLIACGGGGGSNSESSGTRQSNQPAGQVGTVVFQQVLLRAIPNVVTHQRFTGFDVQGTRTYGPTTFPKAQFLTLTNVPTTTTQIQIEYLLGNLVVGLAIVPVLVTPNQATTVTDPPFQDVQVVLSTIQVTPTAPAAAKGTSIQFTATGTYSDNTQRDISASVNWSSGNSAVATVSPTGMATGINPGNTLIQATLGGVSGTTNLTVTAAVLNSITVTPPNPSIADGTTQQFTAIAHFSDGTTQDVTNSATWTSSTPAQATVSTTGLATGADPGQATIGATLNGVTGSATLRITPAAVTSIQLTPQNPSIADGTTQQFTAIANLSDGTTQNVTNIATWTSSVGTKANVSQTGLATGIEPGQTVVRASFEGQSSETTLTVTPAVVTSITVTPSSPTVADGLTQQFTATANLSDGATQDVTALAAWTSSEPGKATVTSTGLATAASPGQTTITATFNGERGATTLTVTPAIVTSVDVTPSTPSIADGTTQQFMATANLSDGTSQDVTNTASWTSTLPGKATVDPSGLATGIDPGQTMIFAVFDGKTGQATLTVTAAVLTSVTVTPGNPTIAKGTTRQFTATANFSDSTTQNVSNTASWMSGSTVVASISPAGLATGVDSGQTAITATFNGVPGTTALTVKRFVSIRVDPPRALTSPGGNRQLRAFGLMSDGSEIDITSESTWSSSDPTSATVSDTAGSKGLVDFIGQQLGRTVEVSAQHPDSVEAGTSTMYVNRFVHIANHVSNDIFTYTSDSGTGHLTFSDSASALDPHDILIDPNGLYVYVLNRAFDSIESYTVDPADGDLTKIPGSAVATGDFPEFLALHPSGKFLFCSNDGFLARGPLGFSVFTVDSDQGRLTPVPGSPFVPGDRFFELVIHPSGDFLTAYYSPSSGVGKAVRVYRIDQGTGQLTLQQSIPVAPTVTVVADMKYSLDGRFLYLADRDSPSITGFSVDPGTGQLTTLGGSPFPSGANARGVVMHPNGRFLYAATIPLTVHSIDPVTGALTSLGSFPSVIGSLAVFIDSRARALYTIAEVHTPEFNITTYTVDSTTGLLSNRQDLSFGREPKALATTP